MVLQCFATAERQISPSFLNVKKKYITSYNTSNTIFWWLQIWPTGTNMTNDKYAPELILMMDFGN